MQRQSKTGKMSLESATTMPRPYYHEFAWAYDLLQNDPVGPRIDFIQSQLNRYGVGIGSMVLDAGCGTGRYADQLAGRSYQVIGVDRSPELIAVAKNRSRQSAARPSFIVADLMKVTFARPFDAILCRGVLNDFLEEADRASVFRQFAGWLRPGGILIFDVREWAKTVARYQKHNVHEHTIATDNGTLYFRSVTLLDRRSRQLRLRERFELARNGEQLSRANDFAMRCWTPEEIAGRLRDAGLDQCGSHTGYGDADHVWTDRLVIVARKPKQDANSSSSALHI